MNPFQVVDVPGGQRESGTGDNFVCRSEKMKKKMKVYRKAQVCVFVCVYYLEAGGYGGT